MYQTRTMQTQEQELMSGNCENATMRAKLMTLKPIGYTDTTYKLYSLPQTYQYGMLYKNSGAFNNIVSLKQAYGFRPTTDFTLTLQYTINP